MINRFRPDGTELDFTIQEFPFFSFMLGDLHPHVMSIPFVLTAISVIANLLFSRARWGIGWLRSHPISAVVLVLVVGSAGFINTWDMLWMLLALGGAIYFKAYRENGRMHLQAIRTAAPGFAVVALVGATFFSNYYFLTMESQIQFPPAIPHEIRDTPHPLLHGVGRVGRSTAGVRKCSRSTDGVA